MRFLVGLVRAFLFFHGGLGFFGGWLGVLCCRKLLRKQLKMQVFERCVYSSLSTAKKINISSAQGKLGCDNSWITNLDHIFPSQVVFNEDV